MFTFVSPGGPRASPWGSIQSNDRPGKTHGKTLHKCQWNMPYIDEDDKYETTPRRGGFLRDKCLQRLTGHPILLLFLVGVLAGQPSSCPLSLLSDREAAAFREVFQQSSVSRSRKAAFVSLEYSGAYRKAMPLFKIVAFKK
ncbi:MAG: hypothetical protein J6P53_00700 [Mailhella sp.]|nr:hypothetical protein [Mailhella sp.]